MTQQHPPGLELDQLIAKKILGWWHDPPEIGGPRAWWYSPKNPEKPRSLPNFSEDIRAAWVFEEKFRFVVMPFGDSEWLVLKSGMRPTKKAVALAQEYASVSAPHAICLAALAEVETDDKD